ncbi:MAG: bifunctional hydroxymethylpyrimidine kinase/phosphomethylpyrimidine kinase [Pseudomonadota bacterium]
MSSPEIDPKGRVLVIAGSDSGGGAGIQADIKTVTALGGYAATAITALTVQNTRGVQGVSPIAADAVRAQMMAVLSDIGADTLKTGMLGDKALVETIAQTIADHAAEIARVVDPVMVATSGDTLLPRDAVDAVRALMVPGAIVTPNAPEAEILTGKQVENIDGQRRAGERLLELGAAAALVKGGHVEGDKLIDVLATPEGEHFFEIERIETTSTHGTGCTLASGVAVSLAQGRDLTSGVARAQNYLVEAIRRAPGLGAGQGPVDHAWPARDPEAAARLL